MTSALPPFFTWAVSRSPSSRGVIPVRHRWRTRRRVGRELEAALSTLGTATRLGVLSAPWEAHDTETAVSFSDLRERDGRTSLPLAWRAVSPVRTFGTSGRRTVATWRGPCSTA